MRVQRIIYDKKVGLEVLRYFTGLPFEMVGTGGLKPPTSTVSRY